MVASAGVGLRLTTGWSCGFGCVSSPSGELVEETVDERGGAVALGGALLGGFVLGDFVFGSFVFGGFVLGGLIVPQLVVGTFCQVEKALALGDIDGSPTQLLVEGGVVEQVEVLEQQ